MRVLKKSAITALFCLVGGCLASSQAFAVLTKDINGDFVVSTTEGETGVLRAYHYGDNSTVIEFKNFPLYFSVKDAQGKRIYFTRQGRYARLSGKFKEFKASIDGKKVAFKEIPEDRAPQKRVALKEYDFNYRMVGDPDVTPAQLFDDGKNTFIQFKKGQEAPAVFGISSKGSKLIKLKAVPNMPHYSFKGTQKTIQFVFGENEALAHYMGKRPLPKKPKVAPKVGTSKIASTPPAKATPTSPVATTQSAKPKQKPSVKDCKWELKKGISYSTQLSKWVRCANYNDLDWNGKEMVPTFDASFKGTFLDALLALKNATRWDIAVHKSNKVIRITP